MATSDKSANVLRRYTSLPALLHLLQTEKITLLSPANWDDRNDRFYMREYTRKKNVAAVFALCFTGPDERYHHWKVFTHGSDGVCIEFKRNELLGGIQKKHPNIEIREVTYEKIDRIRSLQPETNQLPFLKRWPYQDEHEVRIICTSKKERRDTPTFDIDLDWIQRITLSPWLPDPLVDVVRSTIRKVSRKTKRIDVYRTTLLENEEWKNAATRSHPDISTVGPRGGIQQA